jgi:DNA-binding NarL/FixJ family response regulator
LNPAVKESGKEGRKTIRVVLAEDQNMVLGALAALLEIEGDISVVAQARNGKEALDAVLLHKPDVFITDIEMPLMTGLDVAAELKRRRTGTRVVIVTTFARAGYLRRALEAGASGYLLKDMRAEELAEAVRRVRQGLRVIHSPPKPGAKSIRSPTVSARSCASPAKACPAETSPPNSASPKVPSATISPKPSAN